ncbi:hypothetical protein [Peptostreptococcus porci]|nr:hypothetical protein [Peptostreptococcus porci]
MRFERERSGIGRSILLYVTENFTRSISKNVKIRRKYHVLVWLNGRAADL